MEKKAAKSKLLAKRRALKKSEQLEKNKWDMDTKEEQGLIANTVKPMLLHRLWCSDFTGWSEPISLAKSWCQCGSLWSWRVAGGSSGITRWLE